jgi:hypothetical protein
MRISKTKANRAYTRPYKRLARVGVAGAVKAKHTRRAATRASQPVRKFSLNVSIVVVCLMRSRVEGFRTLPLTAIVEPKLSDPSQG